MLCHTVFSLSDVYDKVLAFNNFSAAQVVLLIPAALIILNSFFLLDITLLYAGISFMLTIALMKLVLLRYSLIALMYLVMNAPDIAVTETSVAAGFSTVFTHDASIHLHVAPYCAGNTEKIAGVPNIVTVILASFRGYDTCCACGRDAACFISFALFTSLCSGFLIINSNIEVGYNPKLGTLGAGNHYGEVQVVEEIYDEYAASRMGIDRLGQVCVMIHCGSRGLGHQVATDSLVAMEKAMKRDNIIVNDRQLACARINSMEGQDYLKGMAAAANFAWVNRSCMTFCARQAFAEVFNTSPDDLDMHVIYDVSHNIAKIEEHLLDGKPKQLCVHRKGSTRAFPPHHPLIPVDYQLTGLFSSFYFGDFILKITKSVQQYRVNNLFEVG
ncbi:unnamed protein product [Onchocerca flexuosa]|uniref:3'-phosphate/5'-hydroxy nucleic acid ligase n=1 Tax=Onchocerca flexuosa TaxID=387005 RepID=A0A183H918_9BILA|nr:unnamed protein product [Onchocerca flexuosa]